MKKVLLALAVVAVSAGGVSAETSLLPTQALEPGHAELEIDNNFERWRPNLRNGGTLKNETITSTATAGFGVAKGLQLNVSVPYVWKERQKVQGDSPAFPGYYQDRDGIGDVTVGALFSNGTRKGFMASVGFDVKLDTAPVSEGGTGKTEYMPSIGASVGMGKAIPYITYQPTLRSDHKEGTSHLLTLGSEFDLTEAVTIDTRVVGDIAETQATEGRYSFELSAYLEVVKNIYILPQASIFYVTPVDIKNAGGNIDRAGDTVGFGAGIGVYMTY